MTQKQEQTHDCLKLGQGFELDLRAYALRQSGRVLKLEPTPMELLLFLVQHRGELVTRDQIVEHIWGKDVFLDSDNSINGAIRKIRQVLKDDPERPRFVQTVSGKGYRFIAPLVEPETPERPNQPPDSARGAISAEAGAETRLGKHRLPVVAAALAFLVLAVLVYFYLHRKPKLTDKDTTVLADFMNTTDDPVFDGTLRQGLAVQLEQSPFLSLISEERIQHTLSLMGQPADARLTPEVALEICERTGSAAVLDGSISSLGDRYVLGLRARSCPTGDFLDQEQVQAAKKEDVLNALGEIANRFRSRVGESLAAIERYDTPLAEATTPSLEALKAYSAAWKVQSSSGSAAVIPLLKRAIEIDPEFALAYAALGRMYGDVGESELSTESTSKAYELRDRVSDREKFFISASYDMEVTGNMEKALQTCDLWAKTYPRDPMPHAFLSGIVYVTLANYDKALEESSRVIALDPGFVVGYWNLAYSYQYLGQLGQAENALRRAVERKLEIPDFLVQRYDISFLKRDAEGMRQVAALGQSKPGAEEWMFDHQALALAYSGEIEQARRMSKHAEELAQQAGQREEAALFEAAAALREGFVGNTIEARQRATKALALSNNRDVEYGATFALALAGDNTRSEALADELEKRFPEDTSVKFGYLPSVRARLALNQGNAAKGLNLLEAAVPYELGVPRSGSPGYFGALYPVYVRGEVYLTMNEGAEAATEFQKILDHSGIVVSDPIGALARLQLGRALALSGDRTKARSAYEEFLTLWKDADPDLPTLQQAKREYGRLNEP
jgi:DNA-binding winged helix-turn-helix (wHTH) protein/predicted Zn-dependent protease